MKPTTRLVRLGFVIGVVLTAVLARSVVADPYELEDLARFSAVSGLDLGPATEWFATGLNGDGATFAIVAADPLGRGEGQLLKVPSLRYSRFGYSWLAAAAALGREQLLLFGLSLIGLLSIVGVAWLAFDLRDAMGEWAWLLIINPFLYIGFVGDTSETLGIFLLAVALASSSVAGSLGLAVTRPSYLLGLGSRPFQLAVGLVAALVVRFFWVSHFGDGIMSGSFALTAPLLGFIETPSFVGGLVMAGRRNPCGWPPPE